MKLTKRESYYFTNEDGESEQCIGSSKKEAFEWVIEYLLNEEGYYEKCIVSFEDVVDMYHESGIESYALPLTKQIENLRKKIRTFDKAVDTLVTRKQEIQKEVTKLKIGKFNAPS